MKAISKAIQISSAIGIAEACGGISVQAVHKWASTQVPAEHCPTVERITSGQVRCEDLRPDLSSQWSYLRSTKKKAA